MTNPLVLCRLYRSLLRAAKPFSNPSEKAVVMSCLLHRTGIDDRIPWQDGGLCKAETELETQREDDSSTEEKKHVSKSPEDARDLSKTYADDILGEPQENGTDSSGLEDVLQERKAPHRILFRRLLREVVTGIHGFHQMQYPSEVDTRRLADVIRREFRDTEAPFSLATRQQVAFLALRELNKKITWAEDLSTDKESKLSFEKRQVRNRRQAALDVAPLPLQPSSYLKAGSYLIAHPLQTGYFRRTVICIFDHSDKVSLRSGGTYGLIVNRIGTNPASGKRQTLREVLRTMPPLLSKAFGNCTVREGGPVHMSLQMVHSRSPEQTPIGGNVLSSLSQSSQHNEMRSTAMNSDRAIYYQGDMTEAADAVINGDLDRDDVSFYVGASCWEPGQLEDEIRRGYWFPCSGPPEMALTGMCDRAGDDDKKTPRPKADLWLSLLCALGDDEADLAHLLYHDQQTSDYDLPCDAL